MTDRNIEERIASLSPAKRALLELRLKQKGPEAFREPSIARAGARDSAPLSFAQQRLWFLNQLEPESPAYNESRAVRLRGSLDVDALKKALNQIVARHEVLRTTFATVDGTPMQVIAEQRAMELPVIDLRKLPDSEREAQVHRLITEEARRPFDLSRDLMLRALLLRYAEHEYIVVLATHHIASDGWSAGVLAQELTALYGALVSSQPSTLPDLLIQYADYAVWQRDWLQGQLLDTQLAYWKKQLDGLEPSQIPTDRPRPAIETYEGAKQSLVIAEELSDHLRAFSRRRGVTLFTTLLAAFQTLLYRYSGQTDVAVGTPFAGRTRAETESLIGFFVNTLVMRSDLSENPTFDELLERVREVTLGAYAHQDVPFEKLVQELNPQRNITTNPLFQVMFALQNVPRRVIELADLDVSPVDMESGIAKFDLFLAMVEQDRRLTMRVIYKTDLFDASTITRMLRHFEIILEGIVADPDQRISDIPILTEAEKHQLLVEWNNTAVHYPKDKCIHELFEAQVERSPDAVAVVFESQQLTYRQLNRRANQLANYLRKRGVRADMLVGICVKRSLELVVSLLAILKAGGAYVPLDSEYPKERMAFVLADSQATVLLTQERLATTMPETDADVICLDADGNDINNEPDQNVSVGILPSNLAYVLYTSGSTGKPKGVAIEHRSSVAFLSWARSAFASEDFAGVLGSTSICFDLSVFELFAPLTCGGKVILVANALALARLNTTSELTLINTVPSAITELVRLKAIPASVRVINLAGEPLKASLVRQIYELTSTKRVYDLYGPSEATTYSTCALRTIDGPQTIGCPIANTQIYLLDAHLQPVPIGVPGELYIGGAGVARGYWNRVELTNERFIGNPFNDALGSRLYKTGDLGRYLPNGSIEFLGRMDDQVKIRGYRIELGEIEAMLNCHAAVRENVVSVREDTPGDKRLVAYVVQSQESGSTIDELKTFLRQKLPEYMIPSGFVFLHSLPLTPNGKVDRKALPVPDQSRPELDENYVAARTVVEELTAQIWAEILKAEKIGVHDNFFDLGGHSLLATQVISRLRRTFEIDLPLRSFFESPTVSELAERVEKARGQEKEPQAPNICSISRNDNLPLSFAQQRLWFLDQFGPGGSVYNVPVAFRLKGSLDVTALGRSLNEIIRRHEALRTAFPRVDGQPVQRISPSMSLAIAVVDLSEFTEDERENEARRLAAEETRQPFDLIRGPLVRATLLRLDERDHLLLLSMHHIVSDGWSTGVLFRELGAVYGAFSTGNASPLAELPIQYVDFALWQRKRLRGEVLEAQLSYWGKQLNNVSQLPLPTDRPRPPVQSYRGARESLVLTQDLTEALKALSRREGVTLFMTLLAAFQTLLHRYTGRDDIVVGSPIAGRNRSEIEGLIGFFVNTLVLRTDLSGNPSFRELLTRVREVALDAYAHQDLPFEKLVEELQPKRDLSNSPLFQVMFVLQNAPREDIQLPGLAVTRLQVKHETVKFDLTLTVQDEGEGLRAAFEYSTDLFDATTITRMMGHLRTLLEAVATDPNRQISDLPLLTEAERHQLLVEWNNTKTDYPVQKCIHQLFEEQVNRTPEKIAVIFEEQQLTYRDLNQRANQVAHYLRKFGVGPDVLVGICMERSLEMIIGLLGILKAGGAYVPLDPDYPKERLAFLLEDTRACVLLTQKRIVENLPMHDVRVVCLDGDRAEICGEPPENLAGGAMAENLAYVIYTSGSTGKPKGVLTTHRNVTRLFESTRPWFQFNQNEVWTLFHSYAFDFSVWEIWGALLHGGRLVIVPYWVSRSPELFYDLLAVHNVTVLNQTPSAFQQLVQVDQSLHKSHALTLRWIVFGGEALNVQSLKPWFDAHGDQSPRLVNMYGITEATVHVTYCPIEAKDVAESTGSCIGKQIPDLELYLLDQNQNLVPVGVPAEIYIGGAGLARGYLNKPALTAERFVAHRFSLDSAGQLYRTGDRARYLPDGSIEFLGRIDDQVKIRGYRIEPGEIETVLAQHPGVSETVVLAREDVTGDPSAEFILSAAEGLTTGKRLVAYAVVNQDPAPSTNDLRSFLRKKLPEYMIPSGFVFLDALPLTPNGKIDRTALNSLDPSYGDIELDYVAPCTVTEKTVAEVWAEVLQLERVGIHDNFFDLGGHSLLGIKLISRVCEEFQVDLPLRRLFEFPTVAQLAAHIEAEQKHRTSYNHSEMIDGSFLLELQSGNGKRPVFFLPGGLGGEAEFLIYAKLARYVGSEYPFYGLRARSADGTRLAHARVEEMVADYIKEIQAVQPQGPYHLIGECIGGIVAYEIASQLKTQGQKVAMLALMDTHCPSRVQYLRYRAGWLMQLIVTNYYVGRLGFHWEQARQLARRNKLSYLLSKAGTLLTDVSHRFHWSILSNGNGNAAPILQMQHVEEGYIRALRRYRPRPYQGRINLLVNEEAYRHDSTLGWSELAQGGLTIHKLPGDHETYIRDHVRAAGQKLRECLEKAETKN